MASRFRSASFDQHRYSIAAAQAETANSSTSIRSNEVMNKCDENACAAGADGMAHRNSAATNIHFFFADFQVFCIAKHLCREGFIDFKKIDVVHGE